MARVLNLTPHDLHINSSGVDEPLVIRSDGDLRLTSVSPNYSLSHIHPLHYYRPANEQAEAVEGAIPIIPAQQFTAVDPYSSGYHLLADLTVRDCIIVSKPVAQWLAKSGECQAQILSPGKGLRSVVRFAEGTRKDQIKDVQALEYHPKMV